MSDGASHGDVVRYEEDSTAADEVALEAFVDNPARSVHVESGEDVVEKKSFG